MKNRFLILILLISQAYAHSFKPTNFTGPKEELREVFSELWGEFKTFDNYHCYRRAHILAYQMKQKNINSMKAFFFKGNKLRMSMDWYYHVAPMVYYKHEGVVLDKGLFEGATYLDDWLKTFGEGHQCREISSMDEYRSLKETVYCMYMIVPMYYYSPSSLEELDKSEYDPSDLNDMLFSLPKRWRGRYMQKYPLLETKD